MDCIEDVPLYLVPAYFVSEQLSFRLLTVAAFCIGSPHAKVNWDWLWRPTGP